MTTKLMLLAGIVVGNFLWQLATGGNYMRATEISYFQVWAIGTMLVWEFGSNLR